jgi:molecular chaperone GrpE
MQGQQETAPEQVNEAPDLAAEGEQPQALGAANVVEVEKELQQALDKANEHYDLFVRAKAETENVRRRAQDDVAKAHKFAVESFAESLVPVIDSLEKALEASNAAPEAMRAGVELTLKQLRAAFDKGNLKEINPVGEKFDPHRHQAISVVPAPDGVAPNHVVTVLQKGWTIADRVLRPALVTVAQS